MTPTPAILLALAACTALAQPEREAIPTLDELLGLTEGEQREEAPADAQQTRLDEALSASRPGEALERAAALMDQTAGRLSHERDAGVVTQRLQQDALALLDKAIEAAKQSQQQGSPQSSPPSQSQQDQQQPSQPQPAPAPGQATDPSDSHVPAEGSGVTMRPGEAAAGAAWGALPERLRGSLMQGLTDRYSSIYERATESYYRRLAEEERP